jgi:hypothetical protein
VSEQWRPIFGGAYEVSDFGNVRRASAGRRTFVGRLLKPTPLKIGYFKVAPVVDGVNRFSYVHVLVAEAFLGPRPPGTDINHIDGNKQNNRVANLEYVSHAANMAHASRIGLMPRGERHYSAKLTDEQVEQIRAARAAGEPGVSVAARFGVSGSTVSQIVHGARRRRAA